jgi:MFS family permease
MEPCHTFPKTQILWVALTSGIALGISRHILPVIYPSMQATLETGYAQLGVLTSAYFFPYMVFSLICGYLSDRVGGRLIISLGCLICGIGILGMGFSKNFISLFAFSIITGVGAGGLYVPTISSILKWFKKRKGLMVSMVLVGEGILGISIGLIIPLIVFLYSWRYVWWSFGFLLLAFTIFLWWMIDNAHPASIPSASSLSLSRKRKTPAFLQVLALRKMWSLGFIYFLHALTRGVFVTFSVTYLVSRGAVYAKASSAFSFLAVGFIPGAILSGMLSDRFNKKFLLMGLLIVQIVSAGLLLLNPNWLLTYGLFVAVGFCLTGIPTVMGILPSQYFSEEVYGKTLGFLTLMLGLGSAISPVIGGYLGDLTNSLTPSLFLGVITSCLALGLTFLKV